MLMVCRRVKVRRARLLSVSTCITGTWTLNPRVSGWVSDSSYWQRAICVLLEHAIKARARDPAHIQTTDARNECFSWLRPRAKTSAWAEGLHIFTSCFIIFCVYISLCVYSHMAFYLQPETASFTVNRMAIVTVIKYKHIFIIMINYLKCKAFL